MSSVVFVEAGFPNYNTGESKGVMQVPIDCITPFVFDFMFLKC